MPETLEYASAPLRARRMPWWLLPAGFCCLLVIVAGALPEVVVCRETTSRSNCAANLKAIATACLIYAESNRGRLPPDLQTLTQGGPRTYLQPKQLVCPHGGGGYIYLPGQHNRMDPRNIVAFDLPSNHKGEGGNAGFLDGHAQWKRADGLAAELQATLDDLILHRPRDEPTTTWPADENLPCGGSAWHR